jgi:preprotein translocase subunit SecB
MVTAELMATQVVEVHFFNRIRQGSQIQLTSSFSFNVKYAPDGSQGVATLYQSLKDNLDGEQFFCSVEMRGIFQITGDLTDQAKREVHAQCYDELFPYVQRQVKELCAGSGIPNMMLRKSKINPENVAVQNPVPEEQPAKRPALPIC